MGRRSGDSPTAYDLRMRRNRGRELIFGLVVAIATASLGVLLGYIWYVVAPTLPLKKVEGGLAYTSPSPEEQVAQDGWFVLLGLAFGVAVAVLAWVILRSSRGPIQLFAVTLGALVAGYLAWTVGTQIGAPGYEAQRAAAPLDTIVEKPPELSVTATRTCIPFTQWCVTSRGGELLAPALGAVIGYSVLAGWSRYPSLRRREEEELEAAAAAAYLDPAQGWHHPWPGTTSPPSPAQPDAGPYGAQPPGPPNDAGPYGAPTPGPPNEPQPPSAPPPSSSSEPGPAAPGWREPL